MHTRDDFLFFPDVLFPYYNKIEFDTAKVTNSICISCASFDIRNSAWCAFYPNFEILRSCGSLTIRIRRPSTNINFSETKEVSVRIALEVVIFDKLARSSRLI